MRRTGIDVATSIRDVAHLAGVSPSTVSRVLNNRNSGLAISPSTRERVRNAAAMLGYRPNAAARSLRTTKTQTIGVIVHDLLHPFTTELLDAIYAACQGRGYHLLVGNARLSQRERVVLGDILSHDRVDGLLLVGDVLWQAEDDVELQMVRQMHHHIVAIGCAPSVAVDLTVAVDNAAGVEMALQHVFELGHRSIGYVVGPPRSDGRDHWEVQQRHAAYRRFMVSHHLTWTPTLESVVPDNLAAAQIAIQRLVSGPGRPTACFVINDWTAIMMLKAASMCGIRVPDDLSLVGFDDITFSALCTPGLTTIHQPLDVMGHYAANGLLDVIEGVRLPDAAATPTHEAGALQLFLPTLIRRESAGPPT
jgi:DNA-binding LacI/PurR family transcriptional regulator